MQGKPSCYEVLAAKRVQEGTELEILQLPVTTDDPPAERRSESRGDFSHWTGP